MTAETTTFRSERRVRLRWFPGSFCWLIVAAVGCRKPAEHHAPRRATEPEAPSGILAEGVIRDPLETFRLVALLGDGSFGSRYETAIANALGVSPLMAGLVDGSAPVRIALVADGEATGVVVSVPVTSGREWIAASANGAEARFTARPSANAGTFLRAKSGSSAHVMAVYGDRLVLGSGEALVASAGPYLSRRGPPSSESGPLMQVEATQVALQRVVVPALRILLARRLEALREDDVRLRKEHAGRAPDFGDPGVLIDACSSGIARALAVLESCHRVRAFLSLAPDTVRLRLEGEPANTGAARDAVAGMTVGSAGSLLDLPESTRAFVLLRDAPMGRIAGSVAAIVGDRLRAPERALLAAWALDADRALGDSYLAGIYSSGADRGLFLASGNSDDAAWKGSGTGLRQILRVPVIAQPVETLFGKRKVASSTRGGRGALALGASPDREVAALLEPSPSRHSSRPIADVVQRARDEAWLALGIDASSARAEEAWVTCAVGTDRKMLWADVALAPGTLATLARTFAAPPAP